MPQWFIDYVAPVLAAGGFVGGASLLVYFTSVALSGRR